MRGQRILRYVGNRAEPEEELYSCKETFAHGWSMRIGVDMAIPDFFYMGNGPARRDFFQTGQVEPRRLGEKIQVFMRQDALSYSHILYTNDPLVPSFHMPDLFLSRDPEQDLVRAVQYYIEGTIVRLGFATPEEIELQVPLRLQTEHEKAEEHRRMVQEMRRFMLERELEARRKQPNPFEVNMMEALVGWKGWNLIAGRLSSPTYHGVWEPDQRFEAQCNNKCGEIVHEECNCGIYAIDNAFEVNGYGRIRGQVYGWGRYIRGEKGWRAQFAYPKSFHLLEEQGHLVDVLRIYHVPVYVQQPMLLYSPEEDGYEYRNAEEDGDSRADQVSAAGEAGDSGEDS